MTVDDVETERCRICGTESTHPKISVDGEVGPAADLDTRPPAPLRYAIEDAIRRCPSCGYCAPRLSKGPPEAEPLLRSELYREQLTNERYPEAANRFLCWARIQEAAGDDAAAGWSAVRAAWLCDDSEAQEAAERCRMQAILLFGQALTSGKAFAGGRGADEAVLADLLRRSGGFEEVPDICAAGLKKRPEEMVRQVLEFEVALAADRDEGAYTVEDAAEFAAGR